MESLIPCRRSSSASLMVVNAKISIPAGQIILILQDKPFIRTFPSNSQFRSLKTIKMFLKKKYEPNKHFCRADLAGWTVVSLQSLGLSVLSSIMPTSFKNYFLAWTDNRTRLCEVPGAYGLCERNPFIF